SVQEETLDDFTEMGDHLPFTGREKELEVIRACLLSNIRIWKAWRESKSSRSFDQDEIAKRHMFQAVAAGPGRGKKTLMQRGVTMLMENFQEWPGRAFAWDLKQNPLTSSEFLSMTTADGAQHTLALRILHQAINSNHDFSDTTSRLEKELDAHDL